MGTEQRGFAGATQVMLVAAGLIVWRVVYRDPAALTTEIYDLVDSLVVLQSAENHALILKFF